MSDKTLSFGIEITGVNEASELAKIELQLRNIKKEREELIKQANRPGHFASTDERLKIAAINKEIEAQTNRQKELKKVIDSAPDSLSRMRAELIRLKEAYANASKEVRDQMAPNILKLNNDISKAEQSIGTFTRNVGNYGSAVSGLSSQFSGAAGTFGNMVSSFLQGGGALGLITATVGALAMAWKQTKENIELYLKSADKLATGPGAFERDAEAARKDLQKRARGEFAEGERLVEEYRRLLDFQTDITDEQRKYYESMIATGEQMMENGRQANKDLFGIKNKIEWERQYLSLLQDQEALNDEKLEKATLFEQLEADLSKQRAIVSDLASTEAEKKAASIEAERIANQLSSEKVAILNKEIDNLNAIATMTMKQEVYENDINRLIKERQTTIKEYYNDLIKVNKLQAKAAGKGSGTMEADPQLLNQAISEADKMLGGYNADASTSGIFAGLDAEKQVQAEKERIWNEGLQKARENMANNTAIAAEEADIILQTKLAGLDAEQEIANAKLEIAAGVGNALYQLAGENRELAYAAIVVEKAAAIASIISNVGFANAKALAMSPITFGQPWITINTAIGAASIASIIAEGANSAKAINSSAKQKKSQSIPKYSTGGKITDGVAIDTGTVDNKLIAVNDSETVLTARHVALLGGSGMMRRIGVPGYASGGYLGSQSPYIPPSPNAALRDDIQNAGARIAQLEVTLNVNKLNAAQREVALINERKAI